jgi:hypothetical protein
VPCTEAMRVYAEPEGFEEWGAGLEEADPGKDSARTRGEVEFLYMEEVLRKDVDWVKLSRSTVAGASGR